MTAGNREHPVYPSAAVILIPAFNEGEIIAETLFDIRSFSNLPVLVIDDCSTDNTILQARAAGATVLSLPFQLGAWGATQTGLRYALRHGYEIAITMDADGQHEAGYLNDLIKPVVQGIADVSIGAYTDRNSRKRQIARSLMKRVSGLSLEDVTSGFRVYNHKAIAVLASQQATFLEYQDIGVLLLMQSKNIEIVEVPVVMQARKAGTSRIFHSWRVVFYYMCYTLMLGLSKRGTQVRGV